MAFDSRTENRLSGYVRLHHPNNLRLKQKPGSFAIAHLHSSKRNPDAQFEKKLAQLVERIAVQITLVGVIAEREKIGVIRDLL
jgi:hypothetical protein